MQSLKESDISNWIRNAKLIGEKLHSNCFYRFLESECLWEGDCSEQSLFVVNEEKGIRRIWFYTLSFDDLKELFEKSLKDTEEYVIDIVSKDREIYSEELQQADFNLFTSMMRMGNKDISEVLEASSLLSYVGKAEGIKPTLDDALAIKDKLWEIFDTRISHLPDISEVEASIINNEIMLFKDDEGDIVTLLQSVVKPNSFYINQIYNSADKKVVHALLLQELKRYYEQGGKYLYAWVEESNIASQKFHKKYGLEHDGLWDVIYVRKRR